MDEIVNPGPRLPCSWCRALKWKDETQGMCCSGGKVQLPNLEPYPEPLHSLLTHQDPLSEHFLSTIHDHREKDIRCGIYPGIKPELISQLQKSLHEHDKYIMDFKAAIDSVPKDQKEFKVIINAERKPFGEHKVLMRSYRIMERDGEVCHLLLFRNLLNQFLVDMFAKIESERLNWIRQNQKKLRNEEYIHLKDAITATDGQLSELEIKIRPESIDEVICAELPDSNIDPALYEIIRTTMIHGPCGHINKSSPCMLNGKCTKKYPRCFWKETQTGEDGYPQNRRRSPENGGI
ncbi:ATP-dependent DNA helicase [Trichonephila clavata]|uniref:ATP-dependent DNA helicase n=1 Tax=Trichonephila clavata TaxID=2740835 RepID=A0A8X6G9X7_TRICU|nr:ATP-dependent DNA helicase [Trichonephila clavata]